MSGRKRGSKNKVIRETCRRGHPRTPENTRIHAVTGHICCRECERQWANKNHKQPDVRRKLTAAAARRRASPEHRKQEAQVAKRLRTEKYAFLNQWKAARGCQTCGERDPTCLDLHHRDPKEKEVALSLVVWRWKQARLEAELAKCDVLCANCHRKLHAPDRVV